jgi:hypothetical protein
MAFIVKREVISAPSGFPNVEADGQQISVSNYYPEYNGIYTKISSGNEAGYVNASRVYNGPWQNNGSYFVQIVFNTDSNRWEMGGVSDWTGNGNEWSLFIFNPSSNQNIIPATGWTDGYTTYSVTITAA